MINKLINSTLWKIERGQAMLAQLTTDLLLHLACLCRLCLMGCCWDRQVLTIRKEVIFGASLFFRGIQSLGKSAVRVVMLVSVLDHEESRIYRVFNPNPIILEWNRSQIHFALFDSRLWSRRDQIVTYSIERATIHLIKFKGKESRENGT